jgi:formate hydrogenlyase subunit 3/multisubunit Na+/H+ antiporter MnhD subunit
MTTLLFIFALGLPLGLLLACISSTLRRGLLPWLWLAALPALLLAVLAEPNAGWALGNTQFTLHFALDIPGRILLGVAALLWSVAGIYAASWLREQPKQSGFVITWLMTLTGCVGVFLAADLISFYFLLAVLSFGASGLVLQGKNPEALRACSIYLGLALLAEAFLLAGLILLAAATPDGSLMIRDATAALPGSATRELTMTLLLIGLGMKAGLVPLHFWMPLAYGVAPIPAAAVMSGAVVKASVLGLIRFLPLDVAAPDFGLPLAAIGLFGALYGVVIGITQNHPKHILAYSSVSQMGFIVAIIGMGLAAGAAGTAIAVAFYAAHHLLVKGALFLAVGVIAHTSRKHLAPMLIPAAVIALGLGGLALTGGALTKYAAKDLLGDGLAGTIAMLSSVATSLLMLHFLRTLLLSANADANAQASNGIAWPWLAMALASIAVPWALYLMIPINTLSQALAPNALWGGLWPALLGVVLAIGLERWKHKLPRIPTGDVAVVLYPLGRVNAALGAWGERLDSFARRWVVATISLITLAILFSGILFLHG